MECSTLSTVSTALFTHLGGLMVMIQPLLMECRSAYSALSTERRVSSRNQGLFSQNQRLFSHTWGVSWWVHSLFPQDVGLFPKNIWLFSRNAGRFSQKCRALFTSRAFLIFLGGLMVRLVPLFTGCRAGYKGSFQRV